MIHNDRFESIGEAWLYKYYEGELREYHGEVMIDWRFADMLSSVTRGRALFKFGDCSSANARKCFTCTDKEGEVYNGMVWLHNQSAWEAAVILRKYEMEQIDILEEKIQQHTRIKNQLEYLIDVKLAKSGEDGEKKD